MARSVAFLRGINVGGHKATKDQLIRAFDKLGFTEVDTFLASGNILFAPDDAAGAAGSDAMAEALEAELGFPVPTTVRTAEELSTLDHETPFDDNELAAANGKPQVILLFDRSPKALAEAGTAAAARATSSDRLVPATDTALGAVFWLPVDGVSGSSITAAELTKLFGLHTVRTTNTITRLVKKV